MQSAQGWKIKRSFLSPSRYGRMQTFISYRLALRADNSISKIKFPRYASARFPHIYQLNILQSL